MGNIKKRKEQLAERSKNESLRFQVKWGVQTLGIELTEEVQTRIDDELRILLNLNLADNLLTLKEIVEGVKRDLSVSPVPFDGKLSGSMVAYCLGITTGNPLERGLILPITDYTTPMQVSLRYDNEVRNQVVEWMKAHGYKEVKTRLGQSILKMDNMVVEFKRLVKL